MNLRSSFAVLAAASLLSGPAAANGFFDNGNLPPAEGERFYLGFNTSAIFFDGAERDNVGAIYEDQGAITATDIHDFNPADTDVMFGLATGFVIAPGEGLLGRNLRVELNGHWFQVHESRSVRRNEPAWTDILAIDGSGFVDDFVPPGPAVEGRFTVQYDYFDVGVALRSDFDLPFCDAVLSPAIGFGAFQLHEDHDIYFEIAPAAIQFNFIHEEVETDYIGPSFGLQLHTPVPFVPGLSLQVGTTTFLSYADSDYEADQVFFPFEPLPPQVPGVSEHDERQRFAVRAMATLGLTYDLGWLLISAVGGVDYWDYVPVIRHPRPPLGVMYNSVASTPSAELGSTHMTNFFSGLTLTVPFAGLPGLPF